MISAFIGVLVIGLSGFSIMATMGEIRALVASLEERKGLDALMAALKAGKKLKQNSWLIRMQAPTLQVKAVTALHQETYKLREINRLEGHQGSIFGLAFSPDGRLIASASEDLTVRLWTSDGASVGVPLSGHTKPVVSIAFSPDLSPDYQILSSGSYDGYVKLWKWDGSLIKTLPQRHNGRVISVTFSPGGQILASASDDGTVMLWNRADDFSQPTILNHDKSVASVNFSHFGKLVSADFAGNVKLWTLAGDFIKTLSHGSPVLSVRFSPDGKTIASAGFDGSVKLWSQAGKLIANLEGHEGLVYRVLFSPDSLVVASVGADGTVRLWRREDGKLLHLLRGHQDAVYRVQFSPDGQIVATAGVDDTIKLWSRDDGTLLESLEGHQDEILGLAFSPTELLLASASVDGTLRQWNLDSPVRILPHDYRVYDIGFRPDGRVVASSGLGTIRLWRQDGALRSYIDASSTDVYSLSYSPDGQVLASGDADGNIKLWRPDISTSKPFAIFPAQQQGVLSVRFSPDGRLLASGGADRTVKLWTPDGQLIETLQHQGPVSEIDFSPDSQVLAAASSAPPVSKHGEIRLWTLKTMAPGRLETKPLLTFDNTTPDGHQGDVFSVRFSPDGRRLASGGSDRTVKLWKLDGSLIKTLNGHSDSVTRVSFSPNGKLLASASRDGSVKLWVAEGRLISTLKRHRREVSGVSFSPINGEIIASASYDNSALLWQLPKDFSDDVLHHLLVRGCQSISSYLRTSQEIYGEVQYQKDKAEIKTFCRQITPQAKQP